MWASYDRDDGIEPIGWKHPGIREVANAISSCYVYMPYYVLGMSRRRITCTKPSKPRNRRLEPRRTACTRAVYRCPPEQKPCCRSLIRFDYSNGLPYRFPGTENFVARHIINLPNNDNKNDRSFQQLQRKLPTEKFDVYKQIRMTLRRSRKSSCERYDRSIIARSAVTKNDVANEPAKVRPNSEKAKQ